MLPVPYTSYGRYPGQFGVGGPSGVYPPSRRILELHAASDDSAAVAVGAVAKYGTKGTGPAWRVLPLHHVECCDSTPLVTHQRRPLSYVLVTAPSLLPLAAYANLFSPH